jgi:hypothetical protein
MRQPNDTTALYWNPIGRLKLQKVGFRSRSSIGKSGRPLPFQNCVKVPTTTPLCITPYWLPKPSCYMIKHIHHIHISQSRGASETYCCMHNTTHYIYRTQSLGACSHYCLMHKATHYIHLFQRLGASKPHQQPALEWNFTGRLKQKKLDSEVGSMWDRG